jgi:putative copper export protein/mono/diheme cytochrome c family protein
VSTLEIVVALLRGTHVTALVSLFGTLVFLTGVVPSAIVDGGSEELHLRRRLLRLARISAACALIIGIAWLVLESAVIAGVGGVWMTLHAVPVVASRTQFGQWLLLRGILLLVVLAFLRPWRAGIAAAAVVAALALAVQPMLGHAGALGGSVGTTLIISEILHLLAAGAWLGGLLPLLITIGTLPHNAAARACRDFTPVGLSAVLLLAGTATVQVAQFMGGVPGLVGTGYGRIALVKLVLFIALLGLAALNRLALTDRLAGTASDAARRHMLVSVAAEMVLGVLVVITAGFLASHAPGTHEQPVWPFAWQPGLAIFQEPDQRGEVIAALIATGVAMALAVAGVIWRRVRWPALAGSAIILAIAAPHLDLLFVEAYPTSFFTSPTDFSVTAIVHGAKLYAANCVACHGPDGRGDGPAAQSLQPRPADLTAPHLLMHTEGALFWFISHGIDGPTGQPAMPAFSGAISSDGIWALVDYLRAHHAGVTMQTGASEDEFAAVPQFDAICADGTTVERADLRGHILRIVAMPDHASPPPVLPPVDGVNIRTILLARHPPMRPPDSTCVTVEPEAWTAFSILLGVTPDELAGTEMLADADLWLRASWKSGDAGKWNDPRQAESIVRDIAAHPLAQAASGGHHH